MFVEGSLQAGNRLNVCEVLWLYELACRNLTLLAGQVLSPDPFQQRLAIGKVLRSKQLAEARAFGIYWSQP